MPKVKRTVNTDSKVVSATTTETKTKARKPAKKLAPKNTGWKIDYSGLKSKIVKHKYGNKKPKTVFENIKDAKKELLTRLSQDYKKITTKIKGMK